MKVSIVIPNYNGEENLEKNVPKLLALIPKDEVDVVIVDDKSLDNSIKVIENLINKNKTFKINLIKSDINKGFSSTVNKGVEKANGEIVVLLNSDAFPKKEFVELLRKDFEDDKTFAVAFLDESIENDQIVLRGRGIGSWRRGFLIHNKGRVDGENSLWASGGSSAFRKDIWSKIGGLNEIYNPFYWEDLDISYRALKAGYKIKFNKDIIIVHEHDKGIIRKKYSQAEIKRISFRNQFIFVWINSSFVNLLKNILWFPYHVVKSIKQKDPGFILGFMQALVLAPQAFSSRQRVKKLFVKSDSEIQILE